MLKRDLKEEKPQQFQRRRPKQARAILKYEAVLDACTQLLTEKGYAKTTMLELSLESGVAVPTIYQYFTNKEEIFQSWFERLSIQVFSSLKNIETRSEGDVVTAYLFHTLSIIAAQRESAYALLKELPQALSSQLIHSLEIQTLSFVGDMFGEQRTSIKFHEEKMSILIRLVLGYIIQLILNPERQPDPAFESAELAKIVNSYLGSGDLFLVESVG